MAVDREQLRRDLSEALSAIQQDQGVLGLDDLAASLTTLGPTHAFHGRLLLSTLEAKPPHYSALIWNLVQGARQARAWRDVVEDVRVRPGRRQGSPTGSKDVELA